MMNSGEGIFSIIMIIYHHLNGELTEEESSILQEWLDEDKSHQKMLEDFSCTGYLSGKDQEYQLFEFNKGFERFKREKKRIDQRRSMRQWISVAAILVLGCGIALSVLLRDADQDQLSMVNQETGPGFSRAILVLDDGRQVLLNDTSEVLLALSSAKVQISKGRVDYQSGDTTGQLHFNHMLTPRGGEYYLKLADGSQVWLNAETELKYPEAFRGERREVWLKGEAYFEVTKDQKRPFIVRTDKLDIQVLGTSFDVQAYPDETENTTLIEGQVKVSDGQQERIINPGEQLVYLQGKLEVKEVDVRAYIAWKNQRFAFTDDLLEDVLRKLERWYDVEFFIRNTAIREFRFTGTLPKYDNLDKVLEKLELTTRIHFVQQGHTIIVEED